MHSSCMLWMAEVPNDEVDQLPRKKQLQKGHVQCHISFECTLKEFAIFGAMHGFPLVRLMVPKN